MPTDMHILSAAAAIRTAGSPSCLKTKLKSISVGSGTSKEKKNAIRLNNYMTNAGLYSLRSEWWHFQLYQSVANLTAYDWYIHK